MTLDRWTRLVVVALALALPGCESGAADPAAVRIGFVLYGEEAESALRGAELGAEEAAHAGELVGSDLQLLTEAAEDEDEVAEAARRLTDNGAIAILGGFDEASCRTLSAVAEERDVLFLNVGCRANALRGDTLRNTVHITASDAMYDSAVMRIGRGAVLWHGGLTRFGAAQLNERFERRFGLPADAPAWASWMAVKVVWEALSRSDGSDAGAVAAYLRRPDTRFDGHKGEPLVFEPRTLQLQQPLFAIEPGTPTTAGPAAEALARHASLPLASEVDLGAGPHLLVSNEGSLDISVVDLATGAAIARLPVEQRPRGIHLNSAGSRAYVALSDDAPLIANDADAVAVFDLESGTEVARFPVGSDPEQFGITPDGSRLYASNEDAGTATATDLRSGEILSTVVVGIEPEGVAVSPDGRWVYVTAETSNTVSVIDTRTEQVVASFLVDLRPRGVAFSPSSERAYVTNEISGTVSVVDAAQHRVLTSIPLGPTAKPVGVVVSPDGGTVFVANGHGNSVAVIDAARDSLVAEIPTGRRPWGIAISPDGAFVYTANGGSNDVSEIEVATMQVVRTIPVGERPWGVVFRPSGN